MILAALFSISGEEDGEQRGVKRKHEDEEEGEDS